MPNQPEDNKNPEATPIKDIIEKVLSDLWRVSIKS
jgi:hypothetical protein